MNTQRLGCLSPLAIISAFVTLMILIVAEFTSGNSMFSPGLLNGRAGAALGGVTSHSDVGKDCGQCHAPFWSQETMSDRCLVCHAVIQDELADSSSLHGALSRDAWLTCQSCHTEHNGISASLTVIDSENFPHEVTGFDLIEHQTRDDNTPIVCDDCHSEGFATFDRQTCVACHRSLDEVYMLSHIQAFGDACLACHDGLDRYGDFDHSRVSFTLTGAHTQVDCSGCHLNARTIADLQNTPAACESCHLSDDEHDGEFGTQCGVCHQTEGWEPAIFDHSLTTFSLEGKHADVECADCHKGQVFKGTSSECAACHIDPEFHAGMFPGQACSACHTTAAWSPADYNGPHTFPMNHGEENNACADCHQPNLTQWTCYTCHERAEVEQKHREEGIANFSDCLRCHPTGQEDEAEGGEGDDD